MANNKREYFSINLSIEDLLDYYRGRTSQVVVRAESNKMLQFRLIHLRKYVTPSGIQGRFIIDFDENDKFVDIQMCPKTKITDHIDPEQGGDLEGKSSKNEQSPNRLDLFC